MHAAAILDTLVSAGLQLIAEDGKLVVRPKHLITPAWRDLIRRKKAELVELLSPTPSLHQADVNAAHPHAQPIVPSSATIHASAVDHPEDPPRRRVGSEAALTERAAIIAEGTGCSPLWSDLFMRLSARQRPRSIPVDRWQQIILDAAHLLDADRDSRSEAQRLNDAGWTVMDLLGCCPKRPLRLDLAGLVIALDGGTIIETTPDQTMIRHRDGSNWPHWRWHGQEVRVTLLDLPD